VGGISEEKGRNPFLTEVFFLQSWFPCISLERRLRRNPFLTEVFFLQVWAQKILPRVRRNPFLTEVFFLPLLFVEEGFAVRVAIPS